MDDLQISHIISDIIEEAFATKGIEVHVRPKIFTQPRPDRFNVGIESCDKGLMELADRFSDKLDGLFTIESGESYERGFKDCGERIRNILNGQIEDI